MEPTKTVQTESSTNINAYIDKCINQKVNDLLSKRIAESYADVIKEEIVKTISKTLGQMINLPLTVKQVSCITGKSEQSIYKMCHRDKIRYTKLGNLVFINLKDINNTFIMSDID